MGALPRGAPVRRPQLSFVKALGFAPAFVGVDSWAFMQSGEALWYLASPPEPATLSTNTGPAPGF